MPVGLGVHELLDGAGFVVEPSGRLTERATEDGRCVGESISKRTTSGPLALSIADRDLGGVGAGEAPARLVVSLQTAAQVAHVHAVVGVGRERTRSELGGDDPLRQERDLALLQDEERAPLIAQRDREIRDLEGTAGAIGLGRLRAW